MHRASRVQRLRDNVLSWTTRSPSGALRAPALGDAARQLVRHVSWPDVRCEIDIYFVPLAISHEGNDDRAVHDR